MLWIGFVIPAELHNALEKDDSNSCKCCNCIPCMYSFSHGLWTSIRNEAHPVQLWTAYSQIMKNTWIQESAWISNLVITESKLVQGELVTALLSKVQKEEWNRKKKWHLHQALCLFLCIKMLLFGNLLRKKILASAKHTKWWLWKYKQCHHKTYQYGLRVVIKEERRVKWKFIK